MVAQWAGESSRCEDPAPTVGVCGDALACRIAIPMLPLPLPPCACHAAHGNPRFITEVEWEGWIPGGGRSFAAVSLLEYGGLNLFSRFSEDVATRHAASLSTSTPFPIGNRTPTTSGQLVGLRYARNGLPTWVNILADGDTPPTPDCRGGVFATRRFHRQAKPCPHYQTSVKESCVFSVFHGSLPLLKL